MSWQAELCGIAAGIVLLLSLRRPTAALCAGVIALGWGVVMAADAAGMDARSVGSVLDVMQGSVVALAWRKWWREGETWRPRWMIALPFLWLAQILVHIGAGQAESAVRAGVLRGRDLALGVWAVGDGEWWWTTGLFVAQLLVVAVGPRAGAWIGVGARWLVRRAPRPVASVVLRMRLSAGAGARRKRRFAARVERQSARWER